ncbi:MAG: phytanoyl-CoA dioxygenase family protein [Lentisphaeria bacterium]|nr:phytanoyl-CoA dioxygenase family protein [Lentisphaeria bacterium]
MTESGISAPFVESNDILDKPDALLRRFLRDGYLFVRDLLPRDDVLNLRRQILDYCRDGGWLRDGTDVMEGITDHEPVREGDKVWVPVYEQVQKLEAFHRMKLHPNVQRLMEALFDEPVFCCPMTIARLAFPNDNAHATHPHQDWLYNQGSIFNVTCWVPLGDIPATVGGLKVLAGSHKAGFLIPHPAPGPGGQAVDVDSDLPWVASDFRAGDLLAFHGFVVHGARENHTPDRIRLSMDFRYAGISHTVADGSMNPHRNWAYPKKFSWDNLDADWQDQELKRYWERRPKMKTAPLNDELLRRDEADKRYRSRPHEEE